MPRLCVIISMATPRRRERLFISSRIWAWMVTSRATVSPSATSQDTPSTARTTPPRVTKCVWRSTTSRRVPTARGSLARGAPRLRRGAWECEAAGRSTAEASLRWTVGESEGPARGLSATPSGGQIADALGQRRVLAADGLGDARPAVLRGPALALAAQPPAQGAVAEHACDARGQRAWIALGDEQPRHAVAHRALQTAHPGGDHGAAAG